MNLDPRYRIAKETAFTDHAVQGDRHAVIVELSDTEAGNRNLALQEVADMLGDQGGIDRAFFAAPADLRVVTAWATGQGLQRLEALAGLGKVLRRFEYAQELKPPRLRPAVPLKPPPLSVAATSPDAVMAPHDPPSRAAPPGPYVVRNLFAVIDDGCPFMHPLLARQTALGPSTRVRALWDQQPVPAGVAHAPPAFSYGTELLRAQMDAAMRQNGGDELRTYQSLGCEALRRRQSHGAHALGMLLDNRRRLRQPGPDRRQGDLLFVQLPQGLLGAPSRAVLSRCLIDALVWIEGHRLIDERVILSFGGGSSQGTHDGS